MKKTNVLSKILGLSLLIIVASCSKEELTMNSNDGMSNTKKAAVIPTDPALLPFNDCNEMGFSEITFQLIAGKDITSPAGTMTLTKSITLDGTFLNVCFYTNSDWLLEEVHFFIGGSVEDVPLNANGIPDHSSFPYVKTGINDDHFCFDPIPFIEEWDCPVVLAHAVVYNPDFPDIEETSWAYGCNTFTDYFGTSKWGYWDDCECFEECEQPEPMYLTFKTWTINNDWAPLPETDPILGYPWNGWWCDGLGAVIPDVGDTYELVLYYHTEVFAHATISDVSGDLVLTITTLDGSILRDTYWFYGTYEELDQITLIDECPDYPNDFENHHEESTTHVINLTNPGL